MVMVNGGNGLVIGFAGEGGSSSIASMSTDVGSMDILNKSGSSLVVIGDVSSDSGDINVVNFSGGVVRLQRETFSNSGDVTIDNSGDMDGGVSIGRTDSTGILTVTNSGSMDMAGGQAINLGTNAASSVTNSGDLETTINFGHQDQEVSFSGGSFSGSVLAGSDGQGVVNFTGATAGSYVLGDENGNDIKEVNIDSNTTFGANTEVYTQSLNIADSATLNVESTHNKVFRGDWNLGSGSTFGVGDSINFALLGSINSGNNAATVNLGSGSITTQQSGGSGGDFNLASGSKIVTTLSSSGQTLSSGNIQVGGSANIAQGVQLEVHLNEGRIRGSISDASNNDLVRLFESGRFIDVVNAQFSGTNINNITAANLSLFDENGEPVAGNRVGFIVLKTRVLSGVTESGSGEEGDGGSEFLSLNNQPRSLETGLRTRLQYYADFDSSNAREFFGERGVNLAQESERVLNLIDNIEDDFLRTKFSSFFKSHISSLFNVEEEIKAIQSLFSNKDNIQQNSFDSIRSGLSSVNTRLININYYLGWIGIKLGSNDKDKKENKMYAANNRGYAQDYSFDEESESLKNSMWVQLSGNSTVQGDKKGFAGYRQNGTNLTLGFDQKFQDDLIAGVALSISDSEINGSNGFSRTNTKGYNLSLYGRKNLLTTKKRQFYVDGVLSAGFNRYSSARSILLVNRVARADFNGRNYSAKVNLGVTNYLANSKFALTPEISTLYSYNQVNDYSESGAGDLSLRVKVGSAQIFETEAAINLAYNSFDLKTKKFGELKFFPAIRLAYAYDLIGDTQNSTFNFIGQSQSLAVQNSRANRESYRMGTNLSVVSEKNISLSLDYLFESRIAYRSHNGFVNLKYSF